MGQVFTVFVYVDCLFKSPLFGITQSAITEILTRSKTREATNGGFFHYVLISFSNSLYNFHAENIFFSLQSGTIIGSTNVVNQLQTEIWEPVDPNVTLEG